MMRWRLIVKQTLPVLACAAFSLVPAALRASQHKVERHKAAPHSVTKHRLDHPLPPHRTVHATVHHRLTQPVPHSRSVKRHRTSRSRRRATAARRPSSDRIQQIQQALARSGFYQGAPTGVWDAATVNGMKGFQQAHGIAPSGKIDASSLQELGLGSDVAGVAPPRPVAPPPVPPAPAKPPTKSLGARAGT